MVLTAAVLWGLSGTLAQPLFQEKGISPVWLVTIRMLIAGALLLLLSAVRKPRQIFAIWRVPGDRNALILFGLFGMLMVQWTYFSAIDTGNAAIATLLQYLAPAIITIYLAFTTKKGVTPKILLSLLMAITGTFLLVTHGSFTKLQVPAEAVFWGLLSAFALAFYTLYPIRLLAVYGSALTVGWGMVIGGGAFLFYAQPWKISGNPFAWDALLLIFFIIFFGTFLAFYLFMESLKYTTPTEASLLASVEPLTAVAASVLLFHIPYSFASFLGTLLILGMVILLSIPENSGQGDRFSVH